MVGASQGDSAPRNTSDRRSGPTLSTGLGQFGAIQAVAQLLGLDVRPVNVRDAGEIEHAITTFARSHQ
jgi:hypothetical protein